MSRLLPPGTLAVVLGLLLGAPARGQLLFAPDTLVLQIVYKTSVGPKKIPSDDGK